MVSVVLLLAQFQPDLQGLCFLPAVSAIASYHIIVFLPYPSVQQAHALQKGNCMNPKSFRPKKNVKSDIYLEQIHCDTSSQKVLLVQKAKSAPGCGISRQPFPPIHCIMTAFEFSFVLSWSFSSAYSPTLSVPAPNTLCSLSWHSQPSRKHPPDICHRGWTPGALGK